MNSPDEPDLSDELELMLENMRQQLEMTARVVQNTAAQQMVLGCWDHARTTKH
jgi:hypothetical protein